MVVRAKLTELAFPIILGGWLFYLTKRIGKSDMAASSAADQPILGQPTRLIKS